MKNFIKIIILVLLYSNSINSQWNSQTSNSSAILQTVFFVNTSLGYVCCSGGNPGTILKTTTGGDNWVVINTGFSYDFLGICFTNQNTGYVVDVGDHILKTTNSGLNWFAQGSPNSSYFLRAVDFIDSLNGYIIGGDGLFSGGIYKTSNAGNTWIWIHNIVATNYDNECIDFVDVNTGYIGGRGDGVSERSVVLKTTNGGANWSRNFLVPSGMITGISFCDNNTGYLVSVYGEVEYTTNAGESWNYAGSMQTELTCVKTINEDTAYVAGTHNFIARTTNRGISWDIQTPYILDNTNLLAISFPNDTIGYAVGDSGRILKTTDGGVIGIKPISSDIPNNFHLYQNYPNPFNPSTKIKFEVAKTTKIKLSVFDILGREIAVLVNETLKPGSYEVEWSAAGGAANYPSGLYFMKIVTNVFSDTKKMILIK